MGDRCSVEIAVRRADLAQWLELGYHEEFEDGTEGPWLWLIDEERNCGVSDHPDDLVDGCPAFGSAGGGGDCSRNLFATDGEHYMNRETTRDCRVVVRVNPQTGEACNEDLTDAQEFLKLSRRVGEMVGETPGWTEGSGE